MVLKNSVTALNKIEAKWPQSPIAFSSILPRLGKNSVAKRFNEDAKYINSKVLDYCKMKKHLHYIDNDEVFLKKGNIVKSMYDAHDPMGIHVSEEGAEALLNNLTAFLINGMSDEWYMSTPMKKRSRTNNSSSTPPSATRTAKQTKM